MQASLGLAAMLHGRAAARGITVEVEFASGGRRHILDLLPRIRPLPLGDVLAALRQSCQRVCNNESRAFPRPAVSAGGPATRNRNARSSECSNCPALRKTNPPDR